MVFMSYREIKSGSDGLRTKIAQEGCSERSTVDKKSI